MELRRDVEFVGPVVTGFYRHDEGAGFKVGERRFADGLLLSPEQAASWEPGDADIPDIDAILGALGLTPAPEFLLFGSGATMRQPPAAFRRACEQRGLGVEVMDSRAAARAWGVLRAEERHIIAALRPLR